MDMPILDLQRRLRELGRIRIGKRDGKRPARLETFRLTSTSETLIQHAAGLYGGIPQVWDDAPGLSRQWEVITEVDRLPVAIPPGVSVSQWYELWSGGGCVRRCDGQTEMISGDPCVCRSVSDEIECKPTTRLSVILPELPDVGVWRLETHGWYAATELAGMAELLQARGPVSAHLRIEQRTTLSRGQTRHFPVPVIETDARLGDLLTQGNGRGELDSPRELPPPTPPPALPEATGAAQGLISAPTPPEKPPVQGKGTRTRRKAAPEPPPPTPELPAGEDPNSGGRATPQQHLLRRARDLGVPDDLRHTFTLQVTENRTQSSKDLTPGECLRVIRLMEQHTPEKEPQ